MDHVLSHTLMAMLDLVCYLVLPTDFLHLVYPVGLPLGPDDGFAVGLELGASDACHTATVAIDVTPSNEVSFAAAASSVFNSCKNPAALSSNSPRTAVNQELTIILSAKLILERVILATNAKSLPFSKKSVMFAYASNFVPGLSFSKASLYVFLAI